MRETAKKTRVKWIRVSGIISVVVAIAFLPLPSFGSGDPPGPPDPGELPAVSNLVMGPEWEGDAQEPPAVRSEKLQYAPTSPELPPLLRIQVQPQEKNGAFYPAGEDLYFFKASGFSVLSEKIDDPEAPAPVNSP